MRLWEPACNKVCFEFESNRNHFTMYTNTKACLLWLITVFKCYFSATCSAKTWWYHVRERLAAVAVYEMNVHMNFTGVCQEDYQTNLITVCDHVKTASLSQLQRLWDCGTLVQYCYDKVWQKWWWQPLWYYQMCYYIIHPHFKMFPLCPCKF